MKRKPRYSVKKRKVIFSRGSIHLVDCDIRMPGGGRLSRQIIEHPGEVVIIPRIQKDRYLMIRQFRFATGGWIWEFPAGGIEKGESLRQTAKRELMEETGYRPKKLTKLIEFYPTPGISSEIMYLYLAENLVPEYAEGDEDEVIKVRGFSFREIGRMIRRGTLVDGKSILAYYVLRNRSQP